MGLNGGYDDNIGQGSGDIPGVEGVVGVVEVDGDDEEDGGESSEDDFWSMYGVVDAAALDDTTEIEI